MTKYVAIIIYLMTATLLNSQTTKAINNVDRYLQAYLQKTPVPGFSVSIVEGDKILFNKGYGVEREGGNKPMTPNSVLNIDALGRGFTSMAILQLVAQGQLTLDDLVIKYIPWFQTANKEFSDQITIRMCLSNTSGIPPLFESMPSLDAQDGLTTFIKSFDQHVIKRRPGLSHEYCDEGYSIAAYIIEEITGMSYGDYISQNILKPLQMSHSTAQYIDDKDIVPGHELSLIHI